MSWCPHASPPQANYRPARTQAPRLSRYLGDSSIWHHRRKSRRCLDRIGPSPYISPPRCQRLWTATSRNRLSLRLEGHRTMARRCELSGKAVLTGNNVSHAKRRTRRRFLPNLCNVTLQSDTLKKSVRLIVSASALRSVEHRGGLDAYLLKAGEDELSLKARRLKREIAKAHVGLAAAAS